MKKQLSLAAGLAGFILIPLAMAAQPQTIGWIEHVTVQPGDITLKAKIDTGADNSSVHAKDINIYERDGVKWVSFTVENRQGKNASFDLPVVRMANIKRKGAEPLVRPVVTMDLCIGGTLKTANINLANRENFKYPMLIGRSYLKDQYLVDSGKQYTAQATCNSDTLAQDETL